jgi:hypothetical protein
MKAPESIERRRGFVPGLQTPNPYLSRFQSERHLIRIDARFFESARDRRWVAQHSTGDRQNCSLDLGRRRVSRSSTRAGNDSALPQVVC